MRQVNNIILLPSSRYVDKELQLEVGQIPPLLIPVSDRPLLDFIVDKYKNAPGDSQFVLVVNEGKELIYDYLSRVRKTQFRESHISEEDVQIVEVPQEDDLGRTILNALRQIPLDIFQNLIVNFGDTLIEADFKFEADIVFYDSLRESFRWTTFHQHHGKIVDVTDKFLYENIALNSVFTGLFFIHHPSLFLSCLENAQANEKIGLFYSALCLYLSKVDYHLARVNEWYDFGHIDNYYRAKKKFINQRYFNRVEIDEHRAIVKKKSENIEKFAGEIEWYLKLPSSLKCYIPQVFDYSLDPADCFITMEYYGYPTLSDLYLFGAHSLSIWDHAFDSLFHLIHEMRTYQLHESPEKLFASLRQIYLQKTITRLETVKNHPHLGKFFHQELTINSKKYPSLDYYCQKIPQLFDYLLATFLPFFSIIHGDLCISNILYDPKSRILKLVDPRGKFGEFILYGDYRYELAKLSHSFNGHYESIIHDSFSLHIDERSIDYQLFVTDNQKTISQLFNRRMLQVFPEEQETIALIESLLFLSMPPLHNDHFDRQVVMLAKGIQKIDKFRPSIENK